MLRLKFLAVPLGILALCLSLIPAAAPAARAAEVEPLWQVLCDIHHTAKDDPIVYPNQPGASHLHTFYGNKSTNAASTTDSLMASSSYCGREMSTTDHSAYWVPTLLKDGQPVTRGFMFVYYMRPGGVNGPKIQPIPTGLRMIAGSMASTATNPNPQSQTFWSCGGGGGGPRYNHIIKCGSLGPLHARIDFPSCWDGKHLDSADHKSHMAYANANSGACPSTHPVSLPQVEFEMDFPNDQGGNNYTLSSGGQYSMHGDFFGAWDVQAQNALVAECSNAGKDCSDITRKGNILYVPEYDSNTGPQIDITKYPTTQNYQIENTPIPSATPAPTTDPHAGHVMGASTSPTPSPSTEPEPGSTLPDTGMAAGILGSSIGITAIAYFYLRYRSGRLNLRRALVRRGR